MKLIYVVEDHDTIRTGVVQYLTLSGYDARGFRSVSEEREAIERERPDLIIQDVMLPDGDGFNYIKELKEKYRGVPVIFLTARIEESDRILGFELGADDYILKPFSPKELVLRIQALFRRIEQGGKESDDTACFASEDNILRISKSTHEMTINERPVMLTAAEWRIVTYLADSAPALISRAKILEDCFDYALDSYVRVVDTHIKNIRMKLRPGNWIETVRGYGYRFNAKRV